MNTTTHPALQPESTKTGPDELLTLRQMDNLVLAWGQYVTNKMPAGRKTQGQFVEDMNSMLSKALGWDVRS